MLGKFTPSTRAAVGVFIATVLFGVALLGIFASPISIAWQVGWAGVLVVAAIAARRRYGLAYWERTERRRAARGLVTLGQLLIARGAAGLLFSLPQISALVQHDASEGEAGYSIALSLMTSGHELVNLLLVLIGVVMLFGVLRLSRQDTVANTIKRHFRDWLDPEEVSRSYDSHLPPLVQYWVGRDEEISMISERNYAVLTLTGIGGQGKSALAAEALARFRRQHKRGFWDWRDCHEQADRFRTQLVAVLYRLTHCKISPDALANADMKYLASLFFKKAQELRGFLVFDNVDFYANVETSLFSQDVSDFIEEALRVDHDFTIIFTCRPRIAYPSARFREIYLRGLTNDESLALFRGRLESRFDAKIESAVPEFQQRSQGHPLWLNLIASQISRKPDTVAAILEELRADQTADSRATAMLRGIWASLNENQQEILRCMAELPNAIPEDALADLLEEKFKTRNRFSKAFRGLRQISLVTEKSSDARTISKYDLHPLVRSFVRQEYPVATKRSDWILRILVWCDRTIIHLSCPTETLERRVMKAELQCSAGNYEGGVETVSKAYSQLLTQGLHEEFVRVARMVVDKISGKWSGSDLWGSPHFHQVGKRP